MHSRMEACQFYGSLHTVFGNAGSQFSYPLAHLYFMVLDADSTSRGVSRGRSKFMHMSACVHTHACSYNDDCMSSELTFPSAVMQVIHLASSYRILPMLCCQTLSNNRSRMAAMIFRASASMLLRSAFTPLSGCQCCSFVLVAPMIVFASDESCRWDLCWSPCRRLPTRLTLTA